jgi:hypothetical protein
VRGKPRRRFRRRLAPSPSPERFQRCSLKRRSGHRWFTVQAEVDMHPASVRMHQLNTPPFRSPRVVPLVKPEPLAKHRLSRIESILSLKSNHTLVNLRQQVHLNSPSPSAARSFLGRGSGAASPDRLAGCVSGGVMHGDALLPVRACGDDRDLRGTALRWPAIALRWAESLRNRRPRASPRPLSQRGFCVFQVLAQETLSERRPLGAEKN